MTDDGEESEDERVCNIIQVEERPKGSYEIGLFRNEIVRLPRYGGSSCKSEFYSKEEVVLKHLEGSTVAREAARSCYT